MLLPWQVYSEGKYVAEPQGRTSSAETAAAASVARRNGRCIVSVSFWFFPFNRFRLVTGVGFRKSKMGDDDDDDDDDRLSVP